MITDHSPGFISEVDIEHFTSEHILVLFIEAAKELGWNIGLVSKVGFMAYRKTQQGALKEELRVLISGQNVQVQSMCTNLRLEQGTQNEQNCKNLVDVIISLKNSLSQLELSRKYEDLKHGFVSTELSQMSQPPSTFAEDIAGFTSLFKPVENYFFTPILLGLNILIFILMVVSGVDAMSPDSKSLIQWGALFTPLTLKGEWWRLLSACFLHIGVAHLLVNMYALLYIGSLLEPVLGQTRFITAYLLTGIIASATSIWWHKMVIAAGASGAIFGMYGVFLALLTTSHIEKRIRSGMLSSIAIFVVINLIGGLRYDVDNAAHIGGVVSGIVIGYALLPGLKSRAHENHHM